MRRSKMENKEPILEEKNEEILEVKEERVSLDTHEELDEMPLINEDGTPKIKKEKNHKGLLLFIMSILLLMIGCMIVIFVLNSIQ